MNLEQTYRYLNEYRNYIKPDYEVFANKEQPYYFRFKYMSLLGSAIGRVQKYAPFLIDPSVKEELTKALSQTINSELITDKSNGENFIKAFTSLHTTVDNFLNFIEPDVIEQSDEFGLTVQLYNVHNLEDFEKTLNQLKFAIGVPAYDLGGQVELKEVKSGSILLKLLFDAVVGGQILKVIGSLIQSAIDLKTEYHKSEMAAEQLRTIIAKNDMLELIKQQLKDNYELDKLERAKRIINDNNLPTDKPDLSNTYKSVIETFGALLEKGVDFYPALNAPKEVKEAFPDAKAIKALKEAQKLLEAAQKNDQKIEDNTNGANDEDEASGEAPGLSED
ncbi:hypothetical protein [Spirosoma flavum]|uniref:Uncharacterized protein n=1 Tax=Spirosoma flavum TaxID=2048557 RepID=A0ABW6AL98_9BACT